MTGPVNAMASRFATYAPPPGWSRVFQPPPPTAWMPPPGGSSTFNDPRLQGMINTLWINGASQVRNQVNVPSLPAFPALPGFFFLKNPLTPPTSPTKPELSQSGLSAPVSKSVDMPSVRSVATEPNLPTVLLGNGARAVFLRMPNRQQSALYLTLPIPPELSGMGGLIAGLLTNGSDETRQRSEALRQRNILISFTGLPDKLVAAVQGPVGRELEMAQGVLSLLCDPHWSPDDFERLRQNTTRLIEDEAKAPDTPLASTMKRALYGPSRPYSLTPAERIMKMAGQTPSMLWMALQRSLSATPAAMLMMASSRPEVEQQAILNQAIRQASWVGNPFLAATLPPVPATVAPSAFQGLLLTPNDTLKRARIEIVWQVPPPSDRDYLAFLLLRHILGGQMKGSFFERLRTRDGLVYGVPTHSGSHLGRQFRYHASIQVDLDKIVPGEQELLAVAQEAASRPVAEDVLDTARRNFLLELRSADQTSWRALITAEPWLLCDRPPPSRQDMENAIANITADDIQRVARRIFATPDKLQLVGVSAPASVLQHCFPGYPLTPPVP